MAYIVGVVLAVAVAVFGRTSRFDRDRSFYPTILIVVGSIYVLFATMAGSIETVLAESIGMAAFAITAVAGFRYSAWIIVAGLAGHGSFDFVHGYVIENSSVPAFWPAFCGSYDVVAAAGLAWILRPAQSSSLIREAVR
jgi:hypothetical protein